MFFALYGGLVGCVQGNVALEKSERKKPFTWMPDLGWEDSVRLAEVSPRMFGKLLEDIEQNEDEWKKVKLDPRPFTIICV